MNVQCAYRDLLPALLFFSHRKNEGQPGNMFVTMPFLQDCTLLECDHFSEMPPIGAESWSSEMGRLLVPRRSFSVSLPSSDSLPSLGVPACYYVLLDSSMSE